MCWSIFLAGHRHVGISVYVVDINRLRYISDFKEQDAENDAWTDLILLHFK